MEGFLLQASLYLGAAVLIVPLAVRLGLGSVLGYLAAGLVLGPLLGLAGRETADLQHFAEFGVVMMLFLIGLELEPRALWEMRHRLLGLGGLQITLTTALITAALIWLGLGWQVALIRLANGSYKKVQVGSKIDGGVVAAITATELRYQKGGRMIALALPRT